jgi:hypothetical protein
MVPGINLTFNVQMDALILKKLIARKITDELTAGLESRYFKINNHRAGRPK